MKLKISGKLELWKIWKIRKMVIKIRGETLEGEKCKNRQEYTME